jgi:hypothetical protein
MIQVKSPRQLIGHHPHAPALGAFARVGTNVSKILQHQKHAVEPRSFEIRIDLPCSATAAMRTMISSLEKQISSPASRICPLQCGKLYLRWEKNVHSPERAEAGVEPVSLEIAFRIVLATSVPFAIAVNLGEREAKRVHQGGRHKS